MTVFDALDNVIGNYAEGKASAEDVVRVAHEVNQLLVALEPAGWRYPTPHGWVVTKTCTSSDSEALYSLKLTAP